MSLLTVSATEIFEIFNTIVSKKYLLAAALNTAFEVKLLKTGGVESYTMVSYNIFVGELKNPL